MEQYIEIPTPRKLFLVPIAENNHGKSLILRDLVRIGTGEYTGQKRRALILTLPTGQRVSTLFFPSSISEQVGRNGSLTIQKALETLDKRWWTYDLIILPTHENVEDCQSMIRLGNRHGYDMIAVSFIKKEEFSIMHHDCLELPWGERWTVRNYHLPSFTVDKIEGKRAQITKKAKAQVMSLAAHLWARVGTAMLS